ncbi:hypothetical protein T440DRAFT_516118 [Plenodomus tracheiphilus IPT5]|uniref:Uncharacterized protein n=1 Tax=Plenodomus tracheiphilus IPT5 TaxID=1408161 RepID=A0A6A7BBC1_9PLEO|nr:hypothetical protein T440DRAFT_516118 [Plenodomus tracheiphilus IPT5]
MRTASILARLEWKEATRESCSSEELEEQDLQDVLADCSAMIAELDATDVIGKLKSTLKHRSELSRKAHTLLEVVSIWKACWSRNASNTHHEEACNPVDSEESPQITSIFRFQTASVARMLMLYNTALLHVLEVLARLEFERTKPSAASTSQTDIQADGSSHDHITAMLLAALDISRCMTDYFDHKQAKLDPQFASPAVRYAMMAAWRTLGGTMSRRKMGYGFTAEDRLPSYGRD